MQIPENLSLILLFSIAVLCIVGAILPVEIVVGEEVDEEEEFYPETGTDQRFASRNAIQVKKGAAMTSEI